MSYFNTEHSPNDIRTTSFWRSVCRSAMALIDVKLVSQSNAAPQHVAMPAKAITFDPIAPDFINAREVYVVDCEDGLLFDQVDHVALAAVSVTSVPNVETLLLTILSKPADNVMLVVNIDTVGGTDEAVESLLGLKMLCPDVPLIICSSNFSRNNFTQERRAIADASLRLPCSCASLALSLESAVHNSRC